VIIRTEVANVYHNTNDYLYSLLKKRNTYQNYQIKQGNSLIAIFQIEQARFVTCQILVLLLILLRFLDNQNQKECRQDQLPSHHTNSTDTFPSLNVHPSLSPWTSVGATSLTANFSASLRIISRSSFVKSP
jgi:hypothetical protein